MMGKFRKKKPSSPLYGRFLAVLAAPVSAAVLLMVMASPASPALYHDLEKNRQPCSDCHTLHYSEGGTTPAKTADGVSDFVQTGGPFAQLLMRSTTNKLCLFCHDGTDVKAPDVLADTTGGGVSMYDGYDEHSGAGFFAKSSDPDDPYTATSDKGHDLGVNSASPPFSTKSNVTLTCASCHDPHGTPNYRNILTSPAGGTGVGVVMGADGDTEANLYRYASPNDPPSRSASQEAYKESNLGYKSNTSKWCTECHDELKDHVGGSTPPERKHHRADVSLNDSAFSSSSKPPDSAHWAGGTGIGFGASTSSTDTTNEGVPRLRFQVAAASNYNAARTVAEGNQVMCMSCHLAHGGKYKGGMVWPYADVLDPVPADQPSGCYQCHNDN